MTRTPELHVRIRRLSLDAACARTEAIDAHDLSDAVRAALLDRLGAEGDARQHGPRELSQISQPIADAVASRVRQILGREGRA
jgi:hypothetical protein